MLLSLLMSFRKSAMWSEEALMVILSRHGLCFSNLHKDLYAAANAVNEWQMSIMLDGLGIAVCLLSKACSLAMVLTNPCMPSMVFHVQIYSAWPCLIYCLNPVCTMARCNISLWHPVSEVSWSPFLTSHCCHVDPIRQPLLHRHANDTSGCKQ